MNTESDDLLSSMMLWNVADEWVNAARVLFEHERAKAKSMVAPTEPAHFTVCQGIELVLKAFLRGNGASEDFLAKECGHNLVKALQAAERGGLTKLLEITAEERSALVLANKLYSSKALQFPIVGHYAFPPFEPLLAVAEKLVRETKSFCFEKVDLHTGKPTAVKALRSLR